MADSSQLSYRERDVDNTLSEHDRRITRLEKAGLLTIGYMLAKGSTFITDFAQFF